MFVTAGDPDLETTAELVPELAAAGADIDRARRSALRPDRRGADDPGLVAARARATAPRCAEILELVRRVRAVSDVPLVLMGYLNNVLAHGEEQFAKDCAAARASTA